MSIQQQDVPTGAGIQTGYQQTGYNGYSNGQHTFMSSPQSQAFVHGAHENKGEFKGQPSPAGQYQQQPSATQNAGDSSTTEMNGTGQPERHTVVQAIFYEGYFIRKLISCLSKAAPETTMTFYSDYMTFGRRRQDGTVRGAAIIMANRIKGYKVMTEGISVTVKIAGLTESLKKVVIRKGRIGIQVMSDGSSYLLMGEGEPNAAAIEWKSLKPLESAGDDETDQEFTDYPEGFKPIYHCKTSEFSKIWKDHSKASISNVVMQAEGATLGIAAYDGKDKLVGTPEFYSDTGAGVLPMPFNVMANLDHTTRGTVVGHDIISGWNHDVAGLGRDCKVGIFYSSGYPLKVVFDLGGGSWLVMYMFNPQPRD